MARILKPVIALWGLKQVEQYLGWYLSEGMLKPDVGKAVSQHIRWVVQALQVTLHCCSASLRGEGILWPNLARPLAACQVGKMHWSRSCRAGVPAVLDHLALLAESGAHARCGLALQHIQWVCDGAAHHYLISGPRRGGACCSQAGAEWHDELLLGVSLTGLAREAVAAGHIWASSETERQPRADSSAALPMLNMHSC